MKRRDLKYEQFVYFSFRIDQLNNHLFMLSILHSSIRPEGIYVVAT